MLAQQYRLTTKDVRYLQKQKNIIRTEHFGFLWIKQYPNRKFHQCSLYIAADTVKKAARRHQLKRKLLVQLESGIQRTIQSDKQFYKLFIFLNKKNVKAESFVKEKDKRDETIDNLVKKFQKERQIVNKKLSI